jgi:hypothetical protein
LPIPGDDGVADLGLGVGDDERPAVAEVGEDQDLGVGGGRPVLAVAGEAHHHRALAQGLADVADGAARLAGDVGDARASL